MIINNQTRTYGQIVIISTINDIQYICTADMAEKIDVQWYNANKFTASSQVLSYFW